MSLDLVTWMRQTYSLLDWLGDLGGLFDALWYVVSLVVKPASAFVLQTTMLSFFRLQNKEHEVKLDAMFNPRLKESVKKQKRWRLVDELLG